MIDEYWTWIFYGYHSDELSRRSGKPIVAMCDGCYKYRVLSPHTYNDLCLSCSMIGMKHSEERIRKFSKARMGHIVTEDTRRKLSEAHKGKILSEETKHKMSAAKKSHPPLLGKHHTNETKRILSELNMGANNPNYGKHWTWQEESKQKLSATKQGISLDEWDGFTSKIRQYVTRAKECLVMNEWFKGAHAHHITPTIIVYIPAELHYHIRHNIRTGFNMGEINALAIQFVNGGL